MGQISFFDEGEANWLGDALEPTIEETVRLELKPIHHLKTKWQREDNLKEFPQAEISHDVP